MERIYRFRNVKALLEGEPKDGYFDELEKQSIYFACPDELNDPVEGLRNIHWTGDRVIWQNFIRNYALTLTNAVLGREVFRDDLKNHNELLNMFLMPSNIPSPEFRGLFKKIEIRVIRNRNIRFVLDVITTEQRCIRKSELLFHLDSIHLVILRIIHRELSRATLSIFEHRANSPRPTYRSLIKKYVPIIEEATKRTEDERDEFIDDVLGSQEHALTTQQLKRGFYDSKRNADDRFFVVEFSKAYVDKLQEFIFPPWATACFVGDCENSAMWGHYAASHQGCCLIFQPDKGALNIYNAPGTSSRGFAFTFHKIDYDNGAGDIDFFKSMGRIPMGAIADNWMVGSDDTISECFEYYSRQDGKEFRDLYWSNFFRDITRKTSDWRYEEELRLIQNGNFVDITSPVSRLYNYGFTSLKGIIFGIKTSAEDKVKIIKLLQKKCRDNGVEDFEFRQSYYCQKTNKIKSNKLDLNLGD
ncbi:DUF2971 domain-containing protein [Vibrio splendidus]|uniref:DUF2971 domain-containing protein n=1 Tax=Vibrio splendidus TaxID=29497 RepID=UPI000C85E909|nr:DUF2971 domain-containing protein [Vibrio splendidus]PMI54350.1 hypothetical protein BCU42_18325 [Vibrio splendidus]